MSQYQAWLYGSQFGNRNRSRATSVDRSDPRVSQELLNRLGAAAPDPGSFERSGSRPGGPRTRPLSTNMFSDAPDHTGQLKKPERVLVNRLPKNLNPRQRGDQKTNLC